MPSVPLSLLVLCVSTFALARVPLHAEVVITEVMANNSQALDDEDGDSPDWVELYNTGPAPVNLEGYGLSDDPDRPMRWTFPSVTLSPQGFLIVFASQKNRRVPEKELHTDFKLDGGSGRLYVALSLPSGALASTVEVTDVPQFENVSYGRAQSGALQEFTYLNSSASCRVLVPTRHEGLLWTKPDYEDAAWKSAVTGIGYERGNGYEGLLGTNGDVGDAMVGTNGSVYLRIPFNVDDPSSLASLTLLMKYDDGFAAFLNGTRVADANAPVDLRWDSLATGDHADASAVVFDEFDITAFARELRKGENVLAIQGLNTSLTSSDLLIMPELRATRLTEAQIGEVGYLSKPTPGTFNTTTFEGFVGDTKFSVDRGFFNEPITVEITTLTTGAVIRYTTDGADPTETSGTPYTGPLTISKTTVLRAAAFKEGLVPSNIDTHTYLFLDDVIRQGSQPLPGWPGDGAINGQAMQYGMSSVVVDRIDGPDNVVEALRAIPTFSIVTPLPNLFDPARGIYTNPGNDGRNWERPASLELVQPDGTKGFQIDAGLRIRGGFSRSNSNPKHAFRLFFRREYGEAKLKYPLFGEEGADAFDAFDLRTTQNYSWAFQGDARNTFLRDVFSRDLQGMMGHPYTRSRFYHLYLNGVYWGLFQTQERAEASFAEAYLGGTKEDYDVISKYGGTTDGNRDAFTRLWKEATVGFTSNERYFRVQGMNPDGSPNPTYERLLDVDNVIDYMILTYYTGDRDGPGSRFTQPNPNNFFAIYNRANPDGFKYFEHDSEHSLDTGEPNMVSPFTSGSSASQFNPHWLHERLEANAVYRERFADRVTETFLNGGYLTSPNAINLLEKRAQEIDRAIIAESARWGWVGRANAPYTRETWASAVSVTKAWTTNRVETVIDQLRAVDWYPDVDAPVFGSADRIVNSGFELLFRAGSGTLYYTLDGSDPRLPDHSVHPSALIAEPARTETIRLVDENNPARAMVPTNGNFGTTWRELTFNDSAWKSGAAAIGYDRETTYIPYIKINVSEMDGANTSVFMRIPFSVTDPASFDGLQLSVRYDDGYVAWLNGTRIASANAPSNPAWNDSAAGTHDDAAAQQFETTVIDAGPGILRSGDNLLAIQGLNTSLTSSDMLLSPRLDGVKLSGGSPTTLPDGIVSVSARARNGSEWSTLSQATFLVGVAPASAENLVVTELMYHPSDPDEAERAAGFLDADAFEFIEVTNNSTKAIDLSGIQFTAGIDALVNDGALIQPGARAVLVRDPAAFASRYGNEPAIVATFTGNLSNAGERLELRDVSGTTIVDFTYNDRGDWPRLADGDGYSLTLRSPRMPNGTVRDDATAWRLSAVPGGSPGSDDALPYANWIALHFTESERADPALSSESADPDNDRLPNALEYVTGRDPRIPDSQSPISLSLEPAPQEDNALILSLSIESLPAHDEFFATPEASVDLKDWLDAGSMLTLAAETDQENGSVIHVWNPNRALGRFWRFVVQSE